MTDATKNKSARTRLKFAAKLAALLLLASPMALNGEQRIALTRLLRDPLSIFADRSPGARPSGALTQTKRALPHSQRLLSNGRVFPPGTVAPLQQTTPAFGLPPRHAEAPLGLADAGIPITTGGPGAVGGTLPGGGGGTGGGGGGGGGGYLIYDPPTVEIPVPEPKTWVTLTLGFLALGGMLRRALRKGKSAPAMNTNVPASPKGS